MFSLSRSKIKFHTLLLISLFSLFSPLLPAQADWSSELTIAPGVKHIFMRKESGPWEINIVKANLEEADVALRAALARHTVLGNAPLSAIANAAVGEGQYPLATINGDYFRRAPDPFAGDPFGFQVIRGEMVSFPDRTRSCLISTDDGRLLIERPIISAWAVSSRGIRRQINGLNQPRNAQQLVLFTPRFGNTTGTNASGYEVFLSTGDAVVTPNGVVRAQVTAVQTSGNCLIPRQGMILSGHGLAADFLRQLEVGEEIALEFSLEPKIENIQEAIGGGPRILRQGQVSINGAEEGFTNAFVSGRNPRSAVGLSPKSILFVTVDGRSSGSAGMSLSELANFLIGLGCVDALNLDGGGSSEMLVRGRIVNNPSDGQERSLANGLILLSRIPLEELATLSLEPSAPGLLAGESLRLRLRGRDASYREIPIDTREVSWKITPGVAKIGANGLLQADANLKQASNLVVEATLGKVVARARLAVFPPPARLQVLPKRALLGQRERQQFVVEAAGPDGRPIPSLLLKPAWRCSQEIGIIDSWGNLQTGQSAGRGTVTARLGEVEGVAEVIVVTKTASVQGGRP